MKKKLNAKKIKYEKWDFVSPPEDDPKKLAALLNLNPVIVQILLNRGLKDPQAVSRFFNPRLSLLTSPWEIAGISTAVKIIEASLKNKEKILIFGDYDVDGITGSSLLFLVLKALGAEVYYYIPHRQKEGYSLNKQVISACGKKGFNLIITVDCGINSLEEVRLARNLGLKVIITDHHKAGEELPEASAIVNPKLEKTERPFRNLSGVGVVFKLVQALSEKNNCFDLESALDLVALGTVSDIVPLQDENRILVAEGLKILNNGQRPGLRYLSQAAGMKKVDTWEISYLLGPRLNAAGRIDHARTSMELLLTQEEEKASFLATKLNLLNRERQQICAMVLEAVLAKLSPTETEKDNILIIEGEHWHSGVIGIVASQVAEIYQRPVIIISLEGRYGKGSGRSWAEFNLYQLFKGLEKLFVTFGGHSQALGFKIEQSQIGILKKELQKRAGLLLAQKSQPTLKVETAVALGEIEETFFKDLQRLAPFGEGNREPVLAAFNLNPIDYTVVADRHLKLIFAQGNNLVEAIGFDMADELPLARSGPLDLAFVLEEKFFAGRSNLQMNLKSIRQAVSVQPPD